MFFKYLKTHKQKLGFILIITFLCFINVTKNGYSLDDQRVTTPEHPFVSKGLSGVKQIFTSNYSSIGGKAFEYRPLTVFTFALEYQIFGFKPNISHFINLLLYLLLLVLVFKVLTMLLAPDSEMPFWITLIFALHPLHNEVVVSLKNREEILVAIFGFVSLRFLLIYLSSKKTNALVFSFLFFFLGHFAKTTIAPFAFLMVFSAWYFNEGTFKKMALLFGIYLLIGQIFYWTGYALLSNGFMRTFDLIENPLTAVSLLDRIPMAFALLYHYVKLFIWPNPLLCYYGLGSIPISSWFDFYFFAGLAISILSLYLFIKEVKARSLTGYGIFIFIFLIGIYLNFPVLAPGMIAERFAFMAVLGFSVFFISIINNHFKKNHVQFGLILLAFIYCIININRTPNWKSLTSLLEVDANKEISSVKLLTAFAENYQTLAGKETNNASLRETYLIKAESGYQKAISLYPNHAGAYNNLGTLYATTGKLQEAETCLLKAIELGYINADSYYNLGAIYELSGKMELAKKYYLACVNLSPNYENALQRLQAIQTAKNITP